MADLETQKIEIVEEPVVTDTVVVVEDIPPAIPPNRPRKVYSGMWGPLEIGAMAIGAMTVLLVGAVYFFWVVPSSRELARMRSEADRLEAELMSAKTKYGEITDTETQVARIVSSIDDFETRFLPLTTTGQSALYQRINGLIAAYGLVNTTGPDYAPLESAEAGATQQSEEEKGRSKYRSLYPGVYVSATVEGSYQNLRRFIREIETGREFIIVSVVELAPSDTEQKKESSGPNVVQVPPTYTQPGSPSGGQPGRPFGANPQPMLGPQQPARARPQGKTHGETVSLHIEMAAYFRRPGSGANALVQ